MHKYTRMMFLLIIISLSFMLMLPYSSSAEEAQQPALSLESKLDGDNLKLTVRGQQLADVYAFQFTLAYPQEKVLFQSATASQTGLSVDKEMSQDEIMYAFTKIGSAASIQGDAQLATFTFSFLAGGQSEFKLKDIQFVNSKLDLIEQQEQVKFVTWTPELFSDVSNHWAQTSIYKGVKYAIAQGFPDATFKPNQQISRIEFLAMLIRAIALPINASSEELTFTDRDQIPQWARPYVQAAVQQGIIEGYVDGTFRPNQPLTRTEMVALVVRAKGATPSETESFSFTDGQEIPAWGLPYVKIASQHGWIEGTGAQRFAPMKNATRAESLHFILKSLLNT